MLVSNRSIGRTIAPFALFALFAASIAAADSTVVIDFDHDAAGNALSVPGLFNQATSLTTLYSPLGITFSGSGGIGTNTGGEILNAVLGSFYVPPHSGANYLCFNANTNANGPETIAFAQPVSSVTIYGSSPGSAGFTMNAYTSSGALVGTSSGSMTVTTDGQGNYIFPYVKLSVSGSISGNISSVVLTENPVNKYNIIYNYDDLSFTLPGATAVVSGKLQLDSISPTAPARPFTFTFRPADGSASFTQTVSVGANGAFTLSPVAKKAYTLHIKGNHYLAANISVNTTNGDVTNVSPFLEGGDANNDNMVDAGDLNILVGAFNSNSSVSGSGYDEQADLNEDGRVDVGDLNILIGNYGSVGDN